MKTIVVAVLVVSTVLLGLAACGGEQPAPAKPGEWQWPATMHVGALGTSGLPKYVSFMSVLEASTGTKVRVVPEANPAKQSVMVKNGDIFASSVSKTGLSSMLEAEGDFATRDGGPWPVRVLWIHDLSNAGYFVRGDSALKTPADLKPGIRFSVWDMKESTLRWPRALLQWAKVNEKDVIWADMGTTDASVRAVTDGRADIMFFFPISPMMYEASAAPRGIRFIDLDPNKDPEGVKRFYGVIPGITFAPIAVGPEGAKGRWGTVTHQLMITRQSSDTELVYRFVKWMDENYVKYKDAFSTNVYMTLDNLVDALGFTFVPAHEGLIKYLKEKGRWTDALEARNNANLALLDTQIKAYRDAMDQATKSGIDIAPNNKAWLDFWAKYRADNKIPPVG